MTTGTPTDTLDDRAQQLLRTLIGRFIREGHPVGSRTLAKDSGLELSPATIRNIMSDLEDLGFVASPHTSAGRVPTIKGYRFFVDTLVRLKPPRGEELERFRLGLRDYAGDPQALALNASNLLSAFTKLAGVVTVPRRSQMSLRHVEFLRLSGRRVLAILVINESEVQNKILELNRDFSESELRQASNYLTEQLRGQDLYQLRDKLIRELNDTRESMNALMREAIDLAKDLLPDQVPDADFIVRGETNLMGIEELADMERLKELFEAFSRRQDVLHLLDQSLHADGVQILIGQESGYRAFDGYSIVAAPYQAEDDAMGVLGVIGPTRMAYERVIPIVDVTAKLLGKALSARN